MAQEAFMVQGFCETAKFGLAGSVAVELLRWGNRYLNGEGVDNWRNYLIASACFIALGGVVAGIHGGSPLTMYAAAQLGATAPAILGGIISGRKAARARGKGAAPTYSSATATALDASSW